MYINGMHRQEIITIIRKYSNGPDREYSLALELAIRFFARSSALLVSRLGAKALTELEGA
jgi:hypothetical protein